MGFMTAFPGAHSGSVLGKPHGFPYRTHAGGRDTSSTVVQRIMPRRKGFTAFVNTAQPTPGAQSYAYTNHNVITQPVVGQGAVAALTNPPNPYQRGMMYMPQPSTVTSGLGGYANGTIMAQGLIALEDSPGYTNEVGANYLASDGGTF